VGKASITSLPSLSSYQIAEGIQGCPSPASDPDNADGKQGRSKLASEGLKGFGCLASSLDVRDAVAVEGSLGSKLLCKPPKRARDREETQAGRRKRGRRGVREIG